MKIAAYLTSRQAVSYWRGSQSHLYKPNCPQSGKMFVGKGNKDSVDGEIVTAGIPRLVTSTIEIANERRSTWRKPLNGLMAPHW